MQPVAILFDNFGPYHLARISAAAKQFPVVGVEMFSQSDEYQWRVSEQTQGWEKKVINHDRRRNPSSREAHAESLIATLESIRPRAVAIPGWSAHAALVALWWCRKQRIPAVLMSESAEQDAVRSPWKEWVKRRLIGSYDAALVGGKPHVRYLQRLGLPADRIFEGYDVVDNAFFAAGAAEARSQEAYHRARLALPERYFLASARFITKKNLTRLLEAYSQYLAWQRARGKWRGLVLLGDGPLRSELISVIDRLNLVEAVQLPGFRQADELPFYYALAEFFVHASTTEQWGLVVNEAMACGLPVVVSERCGCVEDLVHNGVNGYRFCPEDTGQLTRLLIELESNRDRLATLGGASRKLIADWDPTRFGEGLRKAVGVAFHAGTHTRPALLDDEVLRIYLRLKER